MNRILTNTALAVVLGFSVVSALPVMAAPLTEGTLVAEVNNDVLPNLDPKAPLFDLTVIDQMMSEAMSMVSTGLAAMQSSSPELKKMGMEMVQKGQAQIEMLSKLREAIIKSSVNKMNG